MFATVSNPTCRAAWSDSDLRPLRLIPMPGTRIEEAVLFVRHPIQLGKKLNHLVVRIAVIGRHVVPRAVPDRSPYDFDLFLGQKIARIVQMHASRISNAI